MTNKPIQDDVFVHRSDLEGCEALNKDDDVSSYTSLGV